MTRKVDSRMGVFDAVMWGVEDDPLLRSVVTLVVMLNKRPNRKILRQRFEEMTVRVPSMRRRAVGNPISLVPPRWESVEDFDLDFHLRYRRASGSRDQAHVLDIAEHMAEMDFDRARPLWDAVVIEGLKDAKAAMIMKIHHAITDGLGGMAIAATIFDLTDEPSRTVTAEDLEVEETGHEDFKERVVEGLEYQARTAVDQVRAVADKGKSIVTGAVTNPVGTVRSGVDFTSSAARILAPASTPMSPVMRGRSLGVHFAVLEAPLEALKRVSHWQGATLNDTFMAVVAGGIARYHAAHGVTLEEAPAVRVNMPVNLRHPGEAPTQGNRWVPARFPLPLGPKDPAGRIQALHPILKQARTEPALEISEPVYRLLTSLPRPATAALAAGMMKGTDVAATNVPGPPVPICSAGARIEQLIPFAPKGGAAMNIALLSYDGRAELGINIDTAAIYDHEVMVRCLSEALDEILALSDAD
ncbi:MAG: wax ester/triacylglycerol synthase family O-acyltransferase [Candidatus Nanopelagicales bacterium]|nr:wax ester/triacylglycerol synthase family O-acyltransferase [Candidatus Nanopelagicales bacterium]